MAQVPDLISLLGLDPRQSRSSFDGHHRTILISKDFTNTGDFVFNNLLQYFSRKESKTPLLLITLSQDWSNYSSIAARCGSNLRRTENMGNIEVLNIMTKFLDSYKIGNQDIDICKHLQESAIEFIKKHTPSGLASLKPIIIMIDDLSILSTIGTNSEEVYRLISSINSNLRKRSELLNDSQTSFLVLQSTVTHMRTNETLRDHEQWQGDDMDYVIANIGNQCDIVMILKPLDTGYSTRVDGTIKIIDNRLPPATKSPTTTATIDSQALPSISSMLTLDTRAQIGMTRTFFYKLSDRRARLTSSALIM